MINNKFFRLLASFISISLISCATPRNPDGTIDACKRTKPPKEAVTKNASHVGRLFIYPDKIEENYSGCQKIWLGDYNQSPANSHLLFSLHFESGKIYQLEGYEPDKEKIVYDYDKNKKLIKGPTKECPSSDDLKPW